MSFAKLDSGIVNSTLWVQPDDVLRVWIWFLSQADAHGMVRTAAPALALVCMKPVDRVREILALLEAPDPDSRSEVDDGRRIRKVSGGWQIINYAAYRARVSAEEKKENDRVRIAEKRAAAREDKSQHVETCSDVSQPVASVASVVNVAQAEAEVEEEVEAKKSKSRGRVAPSAIPEWLDPAAWADWHGYRNSRKGWTPKARELSLRTLEALHADGHDPVAVIEQSIERGWTGLFPVHDQRAAARGSPPASAPGKQMQGLMNLEERKRELQQRRLAGNRDSDRPAETRLPLA